MLRIITKIANKESLTTKVTLTFIGLAAVVCGGYILFLAIAAPQQLAEATTAATNVVCRGCVGSSDIGDGSIQSVDIANGQVGSVDIGQGQVARGDIQNDAIRPNIQIKNSGNQQIEAGTGEDILVDCPAGTILTGGGYTAASVVKILHNIPFDSNTWRVDGINESTANANMIGYVVCIGPMP